MVREYPPMIRSAAEYKDRADFVYMVPPFIAYYGALQGGKNGQDLMQIAYDQCRLYRDALSDDSGLWKHVELGTWQDNTHWGTGMNIQHYRSGYRIKEPTCH